MAATKSGKTAGRKPESKKAKDGRQGKSEHQKMRPYLVFQYVMRQSDEQHAVTIEQIADYLNDDCGIMADDRTLKDDINEINLALYMLENACTLEVALEDLEHPEEDDSFIRSTGKRDEYYVAKRPNDVTDNDVRMLAEIIYAARYLSRKDAGLLVKMVGSLVSTHTERLMKDRREKGSSRPRETAVYDNLSVIREAMRSATKSSRKNPVKITFKYQRYSIDNVEKRVDRRGGATYKVSPYEVILYEENYYLRAFDDRSQEMRTYRIDRMKNVQLTDEPLDGEERYDRTETDNLSQRVFGMFMGRRERVTLRFEMQLLDTAIERFGRNGVVYTQIDDSHFEVSPEVEVSSHFFAWVCRFGTQVKILGPEAVAEEFRGYLGDILSVY